MGWELIVSSLHICMVLAAVIAFIWTVIPQR